jgi:hypothetical protein
MIYAEFIIVNKTDKDIKIRGQTICRKSNDYLWDSKETKIKIVVEDEADTYFESSVVDIKT